MYDSGWGDRICRGKCGEDKELYDFGAEDKIPPHGRGDQSVQQGPMGFSLHAGDQGFWASMGSDRALLPSPSETGWGSLPISAEAATSWLKSLLTIGGCSADEVKNLGTHSCKVTALSWCAKAGLSKEVRAILGYHSPKGSVMVYGRDNQAEPLRQLDGILKDCHG